MDSGIPPSTSYPQPSEFGAAAFIAEQAQAFIDASEQSAPFMAMAMAPDTHAGV
ncbi:hypothetical protein JKG47_06690 [Acidithiobacillus sp. MC6.1]|nr:hypothetical protein [Acidithiobacillus sp. MC6.1]